MRRYRTLTAIAASFFLFANAGAQEPVHRIGLFLNNHYPEGQRELLEGLRELGYVSGRNIQLDYRYVQGQSERIPALVAELVALRPEIIVTSSPQNTLAAHAAAPTIPLVFMGVA